MPTRVLLLGLDAFEPSLLDRWMTEGKLPATQALTMRGISGPVLGVEGFSGSTWPTFYTGLNPAGHGFHRIDQIEPGSYGFHRPLDTETGLGGTPLWKLASDAHRRVAVLDVPLTHLDPSLNGVQIVGWGGHDAITGFETSPPGLAGDVLASVGRHPVPSDCNAHGTSIRDFQRFVTRLEQGIEKKTALTLDLLDRDEWDLFVQVFTEGHCVGHQCWHLHDPTHPGYDERARAAVGDPLERVYVAIDRAVEAIVERAGDAHVIVFSAHGMGPYRGANFLLREILYRLGVTVPPEVPQASRRPVGDRLARPLHSAASALPSTVREPLGRVRRRLAEHSTTPRTKHVSDWADTALSRCFAVSNGHPVSTIRLNLAGREPHGTLRPGSEVDAFCDRLKDDLLEIVDERTNTPLIVAVDRTDSLYEGARRDALPDLLVTWNDAVATGSLVYAGGRGAVVRARSPKIGVVEGRNGYIRTGEHLHQGFFVAVGPGVPVVKREDPVRSTDFYPTVCSMLGIEVPDVDGAPIAELMAART